MSQAESVERKVDRFEVFHRIEDYRDVRHVWVKNTKGEKVQHTHFMFDSQGKLYHTCMSPNMCEKVNRA